MWRNFNRKIAKHYLISVCTIFAAALLITAAVVFALSGSSSHELTTVQKWLVIVLCALVPTGTYSGYVIGFVRMGGLSAQQMMLFAAFCTVIAIVIVPFGIIMIPPTVIQCFKIIRKN